jgi:hypothetical protein
LNPRIAPGPDGITSDILTLVFKSIPKTVTSTYNECLKRGYFPREWKIAKIIPIIKPGKEDSQDPSKYRPISLLNIGGKVLEKLLINRIMHYIYQIEYINDSQYGFTPQKSTTDAAMAVKQFIEPELASLDVKGAFDTAWLTPPFIVQNVFHDFIFAACILPSYSRLPLKYFSFLSCLRLSLLVVL